MTHRQNTAVTQQHIVLSILMVSLLVLCLTACGTTTSAAPTAPPDSVLGGPTQAPTFTHVRQTIDGLYQHQPGIVSYQVQAVTYTPKTRDKVLTTCRQGSIAQTTRELETQRVMACAPLIYFFDRYGDQNSVPESIEVARQLYLYATAHNQHPYNATKVLADLLRSWGIR